MAAIGRRRLLGWLWKPWCCFDWSDDGRSIRVFVLLTRVVVMIMRYQDWREVWCDALNYSRTCFPPHLVHMADGALSIVGK